MGSCLLLFLFFFSRVFFLNSGPLFFDAPEYLTRFSLPDFLHALLSGHVPFHAGYIVLFWPVYHLFGAQGVLFFQTLLATLAIFCFYETVIFLTNKRVALFSSIITSLLPIWWIATATIMMESAYSSLFLISWYCLLRYARKNTWYFLSGFLLCFCLAFLTHIVVLLWVPLLGMSLFFFPKRTLSFVTLFIGIVFAILIHILLASSTLHSNFFQGIAVVFGSKAQEHMQLTFSTYGILVFFRNIVVPTVTNNTLLIVIISMISLLVLFKKHKLLFWFSFFWFLPILLVDQWWDSLLFGRHALLASFGFAFLTAWLLQKHTKIQVLVIGYVVCVSIPAMMLLKQPIPYIEEANALRNLPKRSLLIETHFARPQVESVYQGKTIFVNEPSEQTPLVSTIKQYLLEKKHVFVTAQALSDPYGLYSGPYLHALSLSYLHPPLLQGILKDVSFTGYKTISAEENVIIYQIVAGNPAVYPKVKNMQGSRRQINAFDPLMFFLTASHF